ncbi:MAG TPA: hypothetical protein VJK03_03725 [Candidatus Nanoarchaeia archaeon]|nr:hypothetical protein [Candidatus Nanoarchaeia archaeon]
MAVYSGLINYKPLLSGEGVTIAAKDINAHRNLAKYFSGDHKTTKRKPKEFCDKGKGDNEQLPSVRF